jgi:RNA polymerase sigma factor (sigma-70 family)
MTQAHARSVIGPLRRWVEEQSANKLSDRELLGRFIAEQDETAFAAIVRRHGPLVLRVAGRVLRHRQDTEDVFQATFLLLARKAGTIRKQGSLNCWLYGVAHRLAVRVKARASRQRGLTLPAGRRITEPAAEAAALEFCAVLDAELKRLPDKYQAPLLLCGLEGQTRDEAAQQLGWSLGTFKRRLEKGRQLLRLRLARRELIPSIAFCASLLVPDPSQADLAAGFFATTSKAGVELAKGSSSAAGLVSARVIALVQGLQRTMTLAKIKTSIVMFFLIGGVVAGIGTLHFRKDAPQATAEEPPALAVEEPKPAWLEGSRKDLRIKLAGKILEETGAPANGCKLTVIYPDKSPRCGRTEPVSSLGSYLRCGRVPRLSEDGFAGWATSRLGSHFPFSASPGRTRWA